LDLLGSAEVATNVGYTYRNHLKKFKLLYKRPRMLRSSADNEPQENVKLQSRVRWESFL
jgi:hypothetical protein